MTLREFIALKWKEFLGWLKAKWNGFLAMLAWT